ncbi:hypothetical protein [Gordonia polyisoprenivorans]|uniref:hypothetical protein n=1 Tax=Gordonia polyisoprenivorans TaxID=84595 RepID=UPI001E41C0B9|nr:hypothetical protein [Gordonia polyisoprenivorans]UZF56958.1 hypothetical protein LH935_02850 [Gordonia polyisoprenivorans]
MTDPHPPHRPPPPRPRVAVTPLAQPPVARTRRTHLVVGLAVLEVVFLVAAAVVVMMSRDALTAALRADLAADNQGASAADISTTVSVALLVAAGVAALAVIAAVLGVLLLRQGGKAARPLLLGSAVLVTVLAVAWIVTTNSLPADTDTVLPMVWVSRYLPSAAALAGVLAGVLALIPDGGATLR